MKRTMTAVLFGVLAVLTASVVEAQPKPATLIGVYVFTAKPDGLIPFDQRPREESAKHLREALDEELPDKVAVLVTKPEAATILVEVLGRKADGDNIAIHLRVRVGEDTWNFDGTNDDGHWNDAAGDASDKIVDFVKVNQDRLKATRAAAVGRLP